MRDCEVGVRACGKRLRTARQIAIGRFGLVFLALLFWPVCFQLGIPAHARARAQAKLPHPLKQDESCLACHGQAGMTSDSGKSISIDPAKHAASVHGILSCTDCHTTIKDYPHPAKVAKVQCSTCHADEASHVPNSVHSALGDGACQSCHGDHHEVAPAAQMAPAKCAQCHADEVKEFRQSIHGQAAAAGDPDAPNCVSCHGPVHQIQTSSDAASHVAKKNLPDTCASCHSNQQFLSRHKIPFAHPVELYRQSVHGRAVVNGDGAAATCSDCHGSHGILPSQDARSKINHFNIPATCGQCHADIAKTYLESVHGQAMKAGVTGCPGVQRLPRRAPDPGAERAGIAGERSPSLDGHLRAMPQRRTPGVALQPARRSCSFLRRQLPRSGPAGRIPECCQLRFLPWSAQYLSARPTRAPR